ncbi:hypothetical protein [Candidatus Berkiella aquae]|uniref:Uncharacterized protein n=1 Tax=Candidatus Berkiella aquae TaxID=295108 RepID=A0A0Q9YMM5_9GAMM|nr:hypothetical protein [Candidatus Berkiella aquae]MCS5710300.1 hypothetical protein [Candidatus Berkiella aquae]
MKELALLECTSISAGLSTLECVYGIFSGLVIGSICSIDTGVKGFIVGGVTGFVFGGIIVPVMTEGLSKAINHLYGQVSYDDYDW